MKNKNLWSLAALALVLASCAKNEVLEATPGGGIANSSSLINFSASTGKVVRGTDNGMDQLKGGFNVIALNNTSADIFAGDADSKYLWDAALNSGSGGWKWNTESEKKKWPKDGYPITFYTHYPINNAITKDAMSAAITIEDVVADQKDLLAAKEVAANHPLTGMVNLNFQHILSNIKFSIKSKAGFNVYIQSIRVVKVAKDGRTYNYQTMTWSGTPSTYAAAYSYYKYDTGTTMNGVLGTGGAVPVSPTGGGSMILLPQNGAAKWDAQSLKTAYQTWLGTNPAGTAEQWRTYFDTQIDGARIEITYRMTDAGDKSVVGWKDGEKYPDPVNAGSEITVSGDKFVRVGYPLDFAANAWENGKRYTYIIFLGTDDATNGTILDLNFSDREGNLTADAVNNPGVKPGGDITDSGYIKFDVGITAWDDTSGGIDVNN